MELFGLVDLIISGLECQGISTTRLGKGLNDTRSGFFTNMVQLITWAQSIFPMFGYYLKTPLLSLTRGKILRALHVS
jgi:hypothetical protein